MTVQPNRSDFDTCSIATFARARNDWLDSFSRLEVAILRCEARFCAAPLPRSHSIRQRLTALRTATKSSACSGRTVRALETLVPECESLLPLRATIVHSTMKVGRRAGSDVALFQNALDAASGIPNYIVLSEAEFGERRKAVISLADRFRSLLASPS